MIWMIDCLLFYFSWLRFAETKNTFKPRFEPQRRLLPFSCGEGVHHCTEFGSQRCFHSAERNCHKPRLQLCQQLYTWLRRCGLQLSEPFRNPEQHTCPRPISHSSSFLSGLCLKRQKPCQVSQRQP